MASNAITLKELLKQDRIAQASALVGLQNAEFAKAKAAAVMHNYLEPPEEPTAEQQLNAHQPVRAPRGGGYEQLMNAANNGADLDLVNQAARPVKPALNKDAKIIENVKDRRLQPTYAQCSAVDCTASSDGGGKITRTRMEQPKPIRYDDYGDRVFDDEPIARVGIQGYKFEDGDGGYYCLRHFYAAIRGQI